MPSDDDDQFGRRVTERFRSVDNRIDATRSQIDHMRLVLSSQIDHIKAELVRLVLLGVLVSTIVTAALCLATIALLL